MPHKMNLQNITKVDIKLENLKPEHVALFKRIAELIADPADDQVRRLFFAGKLALKMRQDGNPMFIPATVPGLPKRGLHLN